MRKLSKILLSAMMSMFLFLPSFVKAEGQINTGTIEKVDPTVQVDKDQELVGTNFEDMTGVDYVNTLQNGTVNIEDVGDKVLGKLGEVVIFLQKAMYFISIIGFIIGGILILTGAISKRATVMPGVITCIAAIVAYIIATYAPQLVTSISAWFMVG